MWSPLPLKAESLHFMPPEGRRFNRAIITLDTSARLIWPHIVLWATWRTVVSFSFSFFFLIQADLFPAESRQGVRMNRLLCVLLLKAAKRTGCLSPEPPQNVSTSPGCVTAPRHRAQRAATKCHVAGRTDGIHWVKKQSHLIKVSINSN